MHKQHESRRNFLKHTALGSAWWLGAGHASSAATDMEEAFPIPSVATGPAYTPALDLRPARWIWFPSRRCLPNTFVLFRKSVELDVVPDNTRGWLLADSRYQLFVNGQRVQWGPSPADPRFPEADPLDLGGYLRPGRNVLAVQVLYYGHGDGTWVTGKPGLLFKLEMLQGGEAVETLISDQSWQCHLSRAWQAGHYKRWYLRALQEEFDARKHPWGWNEPDFQPDDHWVSAMEIPGDAHLPSIATAYDDYLHNVGGTTEGLEVRARSIRMMKTREVDVERLVEAHAVRWKVPPKVYFECLPPDALTSLGSVPVAAEGDGWRLQLRPDQGLVLTFELAEQIVGWPFLEIEAPEGTTLELMVQEGHEPGSIPIMNNHFHSWVRWTCQEGGNRLEAFEFESLRWMQLHLHPGAGEVVIRRLGVRRRVYDWPHPPRLQCADAKVQRVVDACINTLYNSAQETIVDGMGRERQQYSGDIGHEVHAILSTMGEPPMVARYLNTFSQGMTKDGFFLDTWPGHDRMVRLAQRQLDFTPWGPLLDHGVGFTFDCWHYYRYTGDTEALRAVYPRLLRFFAYLSKLPDETGLLPVDDLGVPTVWMDNYFAAQRHKRCPFNLYVAAMCQHPLPTLCEAFGDARQARRVRQVGKRLLRHVQRQHWSASRQLFVDNLPWEAEEGITRLGDRSLAMAVLFDQCPKGQQSACLEALATCPETMGLSFPANAGWRLWALAKGDRTATILEEFRTRWAKLPSVPLNNSIQEHWQVAPDSNSQWSHAGIAPLYVLPMSIAGINPLVPGGSLLEVRPRLADLEALSLTYHSGVGPVEFEVEGKMGDRRLRLSLPAGMVVELVVDAREVLELPRIGVEGKVARHRLSGPEVELRLRHT